jgi:hypothetical protein
MAANRVVGYVRYRLRSTDRAVGAELLVVGYSHMARLGYKSHSSHFRQRLA